MLVWEWCELSNFLRLKNISQRTVKSKPKFQWFPWDITGIHLRFPEFIFNIYFPFPNSKTLSAALESALYVKSCVSFFLNIHISIWKKTQNRSSQPAQCDMLLHGNWPLTETAAEKLLFLQVLGMLLICISSHFATVYKLLVCFSTFQTFFFFTLSWILYSLRMRNDSKYLTLILKFVYLFIIYCS